MPLISLAAIHSRTLFRRSLLLKNRRLCSRLDSLLGQKGGRLLGAALLPSRHAGVSLIPAGVVRSCHLLFVEDGVGGSRLLRRGVLLLGLLCALPGTLVLEVGFGCFENGPVDHVVFADGDGGVFGGFRLLG